MPRFLRLLLSLYVCFTALQAQDARSASRIRSIRSLNDSIRKSSRQSGVDIVRRAQLLRELMAEDPRAALSVLLTESELRSVRAQFSAGAANLEQAFAYSGPVSVRVLDDFVDGRAAVQYEANVEGVGLVSVYGAAEQVPAARCGARMRLAGWRIGDRAVAAEATVENAAGAPVCTPTGNQRAAVVLLYGPGVNPPAVTRDVMADQFFGDRPDSVSSQLRLSSYGKMNLSGTVFGWYRLAKTYPCDVSLSALRADALAAAGSDIDFSQYQRLILILHKSLSQGSCPWAGLGDIGCPTANPADSTQKTSTAWIWMDADPPVATLVHEFGHNLGLNHSRSVLFPNDSLGPDRSLAVPVEYGDPIARMGSGLGEYAASHKKMLGWLAPADVAQVEKDSDFVLRPLQAQDSGTKALRIRRRAGQDEWLWLEYRAPETQYMYSFGAAPTYARAVLRWETPATGLYSDILAANVADPSPSRFELSPGGIWRDSNSSLSIILGNAGNDGIPVSVHYDPPCASIAQSALSAARAGQQLTLTVDAPANCVWSVQSNSVWLDVSPTGAKTGPGSVTVTVAANSGSAERAGTITVARQPVAVAQAGARPGGSLSYVFPPAGTTLNTTDQAYYEIGYVPPDSASVSEIDFLFNSSPSEQSGCAIRYDLLNRKVSLTDGNGVYSTPGADNVWKSGKMCSGGYFTSGTRSTGEAYAGFSFIGGVPQPTLFFRLVTSDGKTSAWQTAAAYGAPASCYVGFYESEFEPGIGGATYGLNILDSAKCGWKLTTDVSWLRVTTGSGSGTATVTLTVDANTSGKDRIGHVTVGTQSVIVRQAGPQIFWYPAEMETPSAAGTQTLILVTTPHDSPPAISSDSPWLVITGIADSPLGGPGAVPAWQVTVALAANAGATRTAILSVKDATIRLRQAAGGLDVSPRNIQAAAAGGPDSLTLQAAAGQNWAASSNTDWIQVSTGTGSGSGTIQYSVAPNPSAQSRTGYIVVGPIAVTVTQVGNAVNLPPAYTLKPLTGMFADGFGGPATAVVLDRPGHVAADSRGNLYVADQVRGRILRVSPDGTANLFAGTGFCCDMAGSPDALNADFGNPDGLAVDANDNLYVADPDLYRVFRIDSQGRLSTVAGNGDWWHSGDGGSALAAGFIPTAIAVDANGNLYIADSYDQRIRRVDRNGTITTIAGTGTAGYSGDGQAAVKAQLNYPNGIAVDAAGNVLIVDSGNYVLRRITPDGTIHTIAGNGRSAFSGDNGPAAQAGLGTPNDVAVDAAGNILLTEYSNHVRRIRPDGIIETIAGSGAFGTQGDGGLAVKAQLAFPYAVTADGGGNIYFSEYYYRGVRQVTSDGLIHRYAGIVDSASTGGTAPQTRLIDPRAIASDSVGNLYVGQGEGRYIYRIAPDGTQTVFAGNGACCNAPEGARATSAGFNQIRDMLVLPDDSLLVSDAGQNKILRIRNGTVQTFAGTGKPGYSGDGGAALSAQLQGPSSLALDPAGNVCFADSGNHAVRCIDGSGAIQTIAGNGIAGYAGDGGSASQAQLNNPAVIRFDAAGALYVAESGRIRQIGTDQIVRTLFSGDYDTFELDTDGALIVAETSEPTLSRLSALSGKTPLAGSVAGSTDVETDARAAKVYHPVDIRMLDGTIYVVDSQADRVYVLAAEPRP
jgi:M6 family metalloprotease-like protein